MPDPGLVNPDPEWTPDDSCGAMRGIYLDGRRGTIWADAAKQPREARQYTFRALNRPDIFYSTHASPTHASAASAMHT
jgi:hypothetical protein